MMAALFVLGLVVHGVVFAAAVCWAAKRGDEAMEEYFARRTKPDPAKKP